MKILAVTTGTYGERFVQNLRAHAPSAWQVAELRAPTRFPLVIDEPRDFLPAQLDPADLILALGERPGVAELIPEVCKMTGARAVIAPIDSNAALPKGLANQLRAWLSELGVTSVFPKPFCSLTENSYSLRRERVVYDQPLISEFARHFGQPRFAATVEDERIAEVQVERAAPCGCSLFVAEGLKGVKVDDAEFQAGMLHHHFPCLAQMEIDPDYADTLMHVSGNLTCEAIREALGEHRKVMYWRPQ